MRKIEGIRRIENMGLKALDVKEFSYSDLEGAKEYANFLIGRDGTFNLRTDLGYSSKNNKDLPFVKDCTIEKLEEIARERKDEITYLVHEGIDDSTLAGQGVLYLDENKDLVGEVNCRDKTALRFAMKNSENLEGVRVGENDLGNLFYGIRQDLIDNGIRNKVEASVYDDGRIVYWQVSERERLNVLGAYSAVKNGKMGVEEAVMDIDPSSLSSCLNSRLEGNDLEVIASGIGGRPGGTSGVAVFDNDGVEDAVGRGERAVLFMDDWSFDYSHVLGKVSGIVSRKGGRTSHVVTLAGGVGIPCIAGCEGLDLEGRTLNGKKLDYVSMDGESGEIYFGKAELSGGGLGGDLSEFINVCDSLKNMGVYANVNNAEEAETAMEYGAEGIGLCRSEHMFLSGRGRDLIQSVLMGNFDDNLMKDFLDFQREEYIKIFEAMKNRPVNIRLLDPPLNEFLDSGAVESNPMMGLRGSRIGVKYPAVYDAQVRAIAESALDVGSKFNVVFPFVGYGAEFFKLKDRANVVVGEVFDKMGKSCDYNVGPMMEVPSLLFESGDVARESGLFSFGTNDLSQFMLASSRDDSYSFLGNYMRDGIIRADPASSINKSVGNIMKMSIGDGRAVNKNLKIGVCGEHVRDFDSVVKFNDMGVDYLSCSPCDVPLVKFFAAKAAIKKKLEE